MAIDKITATGILDGGVTTADLADGNVTFAKLNADAKPTATLVSDQDNSSTGLFTLPAGTTAQNLDPNRTKRHRLLGGARTTALSSRFF